MTDDISKAFDKIKPKDLIKAKPTHFFEYETGDETFETFFDRQLYAIRYAFAASDGGTVNPISALSDGRVERLFNSRDGETVEDMFNRTGEVAKSTGSTRYFYSRMTPVRVGPQGKSAPAILWYAEDSAAGVIRSGYVPIVDPDGLLGDVVESVAGYGDWAGDALKAVLHR